MKLSVASKSIVPLDLDEQNVFGAVEEESSHISPDNPNDKSANFIFNSISFNPQQTICHHEQLDSSRTTAMG